MTRALAIVLARMDSSRLPGKALAMLGGRPLIEIVWERTRLANIGPVALATTNRAVDDPLADWAKSRGASVFRDSGSTDDVAGRLLRAAECLAPELSWIARINGDSPLTDPGLLRDGLRLAAPGIDYVTNLTPRTYPYGVAVELIRVDTLRELAAAGLTAREREHATLALRERLPRTHIARLPECPLGLAELRLTVDEPGDLQRLERIVKEAGPGWTKKSYAHVLRSRRFGASA
jgi:spore coat polysaccharide biosynthesis protein SpsF (cytidylyltransferase family)